MLVPPLIKGDVLRVAISQILRAHYVYSTHFSRQHE
jgi:hypothetical protein